tara:strand:+ start:1190 stop:2311 length:1122 start_codon:yes stop_codon:yes gene_type:complete
MKILQLLGNTAFGGATHMVIKISKKLRQDGHDVIIMANDLETKRRFDELGFRCDHIEEMGRSIHPYKDLISVLKLKKYVKSENVDLVHSHTTKGGIYSRALKMICPKMKVIHTVHGYYFKMDGSKRDKFTYMIERFFHRFADVTTYVNGYDYNIASKWPNGEKNVLIYNGVSLDQFSPSGRLEGEAPDEEKATVTVGISARIVHEKGYREFIELIKQNLYTPNIKFVVVGTGPDAAYYKKRVKEITKDESVANDKVIFHGYTENVSSLIKEWDINILPSYREGLSISLIEACAAGIPSVATRIRGNVEIIEEGVTGLLYEAKDSKALIECVQTLMDDKALRSQMGQAARKRAEIYFDEVNMLEAYSEIVKSLH